MDNGTLKIGNIWDGLLRFATGQAGIFSSGSGGNDLQGVMSVKNFDLQHSIWGFEQASLAEKGTFGMSFKDANPLNLLLSIAAQLGGILAMPEIIYLQTLLLVDEVLAEAFAIQSAAKTAKWIAGGDPLVIDLAGNGIETTTLDGSNVYFNLDGGKFTSRTGWLSGTDGFLVLDKNHNGKIDDIHEMFGSRDQGGYADLAQYDSNQDGVIDANDAIWSQLQIWQDLNGDGVTEDGELKSMAEEGLTSLSLTNTPLDVTTPQGTQLPSVGQVTFADGRTSHMFEAIFDTSSSDTRYAGETGLPAWLRNIHIDARGFGLLTDLSIAMANDVGFGQLAASTAAAMTTPDMQVLVQQAGDVLGQWGETLNLTEELTPVLLGTDASGNVGLIDRAIYVEDGSGGYWTLASGNPVFGADGTAIARPTMEQVLAQATAGGNYWQLEQTWSPTSRGAPVQYRNDAPYLVQIVGGVAVVLDYGIQNPDGSWYLASGNAVLDANGNAIANPTRDDITAQAHPTGEEWRVEQIGYNPLANIPVAEIGVDFVNGQVVDYTVQVTDQDGTFYVWARNLDRALALQAKQGDARAFNLRNYAVDFSEIQQVNATDDSTYRVELLTPAQFNFATSLGGVAFRPEMLTATDDNAVTGTGKIAYTINGLGDALTATDGHMSDIQVMIGMLQPVMDHYIVTSRRLAVRMALQGGLKDFAQGVNYDVASDKYVPTTDRQLAPMFEAIFAAAPADNSNDAILDYLTNWNEILRQVYPDYQPTGIGNLYGATAAIDQAFILQMTIEAFENTGVNYDIRGVAHAFGVDETKIITDDTGQAVVDGTAGADFFYMASGDHTYRGGDGSDYYFVGKNAGQDTIIDYGRGEPNELVFTSAMSSDITATREGEDMLIQVGSTGEIIRLKDQFLGELNDRFSDGVQASSGVDTILLADGVIWDRDRMAFEVAHPTDGDIAIIGSGSADVLWAGKGHQYLSGGAGGDIYIVQPEGGNLDVTIDDQGNFSFGPVKAGLDTLMFEGDITPGDLKLTRAGNSGDLQIALLDAQGNPTGDTILIKGQFTDLVFNLQAFASLLGSDPGSDTSLNYVAPNQIERFSFSDGESLDFTEISKEVIQNAETSGDDVVYGLASDDTLDGGAGNDYLSGASGSDTYIFGPGYGQDVVEDGDYSSKFFGDPYTDVLQFKDNLTWADFDYLRDGASDTLTFRITGTTDQVTVHNMLLTDPFHLTAPNKIEQFQFGDGTVWDTQKVLQHFIDAYATAGNDALYGYDGLDDNVGFSFDGGAGDDLLEGNGGNDSIYFRARLRPRHHSRRRRQRHADPQGTGEHGCDLLAHGARRRHHDQRYRRNGHAQESVCPRRPAAKRRREHPVHRYHGRLHPVQPRSHAAGLDRTGPDAGRLRLRRNARRPRRRRDLDRP